MKRIFLIYLCLSILSCQKRTDGSAPTTIDNTAKISAATLTANTNSACTAIHPFYWEIGDSSNTIVGATAGGTVPVSSTVIQIGSASKLIFASYLIQKRSGILSSNEIKGLTFTAGYSTFSDCIGQLTVGSCYSGLTAFVPANDNKFYYGGGHMQKLAAVDLGLAALGPVGLGTELSNFIGTDVGLSFNFPQPAGGAQITASGYSILLRKILQQNLMMYSYLGSSSVCTNIASCSSSVSTPIPSSESWSYSLGHWIENDPIVGDGAFSSSGRFGFYPWISSDKKLYGVLARENLVDPSAYWKSTLCGRLIRKAYVAATAQ